MKILLVEDDERIADALAEDLTDQYYVIDVANTGRAAWDMVDAFEYDLILLDVMLPEVDGISLCRQLRSQNCSIPILMLTARDTIGDRVRGLDAGADDYVVKPFDLEELSARIRSLLRRSGGVALPPVYEWGALRLDPSACEVSYDEQILALTPKEYSLLELFLRNARRIYSSGQILEQLWSFEEPPTEETVRSHIKGLRQKLRLAGAPADLIETVHGLGYRLKHAV
ncbi:MAG TPA: response regulator transcription factor [Crinalium sp.]